MPQFVPLRRSHHAECSWSRSSGYGFVAREMLAPILSLELPQAVLHLPLAFVPVESGFQLVAVLALRESENLFVVADGSWLEGAHIPAAFRAYPFALSQLPEADQALLSVDEGSPLIHGDDGGEPFFDAEGQLAPAVADILKFLEACERSRRATQRAVQALDAAGVIVPWPINLRSGEKQGAMQGLFRIDENLLNGLSPEAFESLRQAGALALAYCQLLSAQHLERLGQLASARAGQPEPAPLSTSKA